MTTETTRDDEMTSAQIADAAHAYVSGWDEPESIRLTAERGIAEYDLEQLRNSYGEDADAIADIIVELCTRRAQER